jgi:predicted RNase H-like HicB family nuclease
MEKIYTARFKRISSGYMGQLVEWPAVITEGATLEECRFMLIDAAKEMTLAYREEGLPILEPSEMIDRIPIEA